MKALIVIDMQEGFRHAESEAITRKILKLARGFRGEVIFSVFIDKPNSMFERELHWPKFQSAKNQELFKELRPVARTIVQHKGYSVLTNRLRKLLKEKKIESVYLCGIYTDVCVIKASMDLFDNGIDVKVIADACASLHGDGNHRYALDSLRHIIGTKNVIEASNLAES